MNLEGINNFDLRLKEGKWFIKYLNFNYKTQCLYG